MTRERIATFLRFVLAGAVNTLFGWLLYSASIVLGAQSWLALIIGTVGGIAFNFFTLGGYVFRDLVLRNLPRFVLSYAVIYLLNLASLRAISNWIHQPILAQLLLTPAMALTSYVLLVRLVFNRRRERGDVRKR